MGCFFGCFGVKDDKRPHAHLDSDAFSTRKRDPLLSRNKLESLLLSEEKESSPCKDTRSHTLRSALLSGDGEVRELRDEATPEIQNMSEKVKDSPDRAGETNPFRFHSWIPSSVKKRQWEEQPDEASISPAKIIEDLGKNLGSPDHEPSSCAHKRELEDKDYTNKVSEFVSSDSETTNPVHAIENDKLSSVTPEALAVDIQSKKKSVRFECESEGESHPSNGDSLKQSDVPGSHNGSNHSPFPTPLRLTDEMQTPGTIYPVSQGNLANRKNARIRSQYVYQVLNPVENSSQWKELKEEDGNTYLQVGQQRESFDECGLANPECTSISFSNQSEMLGEGVGTVDKDLKLDASLVHWLKPSSPDDRNQNSGAGSISSGKSPKMSDEDRPILGMVAAHWNDDGLSHVSPKLQDGNGIPNSTTKYKEDQRVNWHATPFEERLEKALSEESNVPRRKLISERPIIFEENEDTDTAVSLLHTSALPESVVSF